MINTGHADSDLPVVGWQGDKAKPYKLFRLEDADRSALSLSNRFQPADGHDPMIPHRIGFHALMVVTHGSFDHWLDFETHRFSKNHLIYIAPNQIHHFLDRKRAHKARVLIFRPEILPTGLLPIATKQTSWQIMSYRWPSITKITPREAGLLAVQMAFLRDLELDYSDCFHAAAKHHVCGIIAIAFELAKKHHEETVDWQSNTRFIEFIELIEKYYASRRDVQWYAKKMDCSHRTLNRTCQQATGRSAKGLLTQRVVVEAKRLLTYSEKTIGSIAESLGFSEATNFVRYFRKETGQTPQEFKSVGHADS